MDTISIRHHASQWIMHRPSARRRLGVAVLAVALLGAAACGDDTAPRAGSETSTNSPISTDSPTTTTTTVTARPSAPASTTTVVPPGTTVTTSPRPTETVDQLAGVAGTRVHVRCVGEGNTTVVLIAGFGGDLTGWTAVEPAIAARTRVCSYDRPGTGTSDPASGIATFSTQADELHTLLRTIGEPGPYVLVGHSFGGAAAVTFASHYPDEVIGLVLVDASPTTWPSALCAVPDDGSDGAALLRAICSSFVPAGNAEHIDVEAAFAEAADIGSLGSLPMAVITARDRELPADLAAAERVRLTDEWNGGQQAWAALSTTAHVVSVDHTGHHIEIDRPEVVIDQIVRLLP